MRILLVLLAAAVAGAGEAWPSIPGMSVRPDGGLVVGGVQLTPLHSDARRRESRRKAPGQAVVADDGWSLAGAWAFPDGGTAEVRQELRRAGPDGLLVSWSGAVGQIGFSCSLPGKPYRGRSMRVDGVVMPLLPEAEQPDLFAGQVRSLRLPAGDGAEIELRGDLFLQVLDHRAWGEDRFAVRVFAPAGAAAIQLRLVRPGAVEEAVADVAGPVVGEPLLLGAAATTALRDEIAGDGLGGWTDQGGNDLGSLPVGPLQAAGVRFTVGSTAALLTRTRVANRPERVVVVGDGRQAASLYLLHTLAWAPRAETVVGTVRIVFRDGSEQAQQVRSAVAVGDWWNPPERLAEAVLGWQGENGQARVGLFVTRLAIPERPIERIELAVEAETVWAVVGLSLGPAVVLQAAAPETITASARWLPTAVPFAVAAGSALDLGFLTPAPLAGALSVRGAQFVGSDGRRVRLQGVNLCQEANFPSHAEADALVAAVRATGCNALRFHHHDGGLVLPGGDGTAPDPDKLDRLEYLIAACRRAGLYVTTDIYVSRVPPAGAFPGVTRAMRLKALIPLLPAAMDNWKRFASNWLTHRNPYTGTTLASDPGLLSISLVNEDNLPGWVGQEPEVAALYEQRFAAWLAQQSAPAPSGEARAAAWSAWLFGLQAQAFAEMGAHLRSLGVGAPLTSLNWRQSWWSMAGRQGFDLVDNHSYHDHPRFPRQDWRLPMGLRQDSATASLLRATTDIAVTRRFGRPFTVSEVQFCTPSVHRAEYAAAVPAVAGTQDWDGLWRFTLTGPVASMFAERPLASFAIAHDPIALLSERAVALLWRRGDVAPAAWSAGLVVDAQRAAAHPDAGPVTGFGDLALLARLGNLTPQEAAQADPAMRCLLEHPAAGAAVPGALPVLRADERLPGSLAQAGLLGPDRWDPAAGRLQRADGAVRIDAKAGILQVAGRCGCAVVLPGGAEATLAGVTVVNRDAEPATVVVAALDDADLAQSKRLLVLHLTDAQNSGMRFASARRTLLESWGRAPVLVRAGACGIRLPGSAPARAFALDLGGERREELALPAGAEGVQLEAQVARGWGPCLAWEIVR